ncbi:elongation factor P 5-aminopentanone reductase [Carnobacterium gallinarum]|uniref:elongation factor P 5-aminopentanone reductase n=1 Tax=Carnobacterium gallinarum TaxID=2749 RepID=UPI000555DF9D|nr:SDR family oxidoreductase [Carnobacterium gallinarum]
MKFALIMGASGDIGGAIAQDLAKAGWSLYLHCHSDFTSVERQAKVYQKNYPKQDFFTLQLDMMNEAELPLFLESIFQLDAVIFASGFTHYHLLTETTALEMDQMWQVHVKTPILLVQSLQTKLAASGNGRIVFISSVYGEVGSAMEVLYSTTKGAQLAFVKAYSKEVISLGITVNAISPGAIATKMNQDFAEAELDWLNEEIPAGRMGTTTEISFWVQQLLEPLSQYMTGQSLVISGGWLK